MIETLSAYRSGILAALESILADDTHLHRVNHWGGDLVERLQRFATRGKLIRGSLVCASVEAFGAVANENAFKLGAVMELLQSFLLIHDDIMDQDAIRRGEPAVFEQYRRDGVERSYANSDRFAESMGICAGDVAVLLAFEVLTSLDLPATTVVALSRFLASEISDVGVAQMADVAHGHQGDEPTEEQILEVYRMKTGRYTFSVPLMLGAMLAHASQSDIQALSTWGELQGVIFQLRDDELGLMGSTEEIGKPAGTDISSDKKTLHRFLLLRECARIGNAEIPGLFGCRSISSGAIEKIQAALRETGTLKKLSQRIASLQAKAEPVLTSVSGLTAGGRAAFASLASYNANRDR